MKISEMTLEQLEDYALNLESEKQTLTTQVTTLTAEKTELQGLNTELQKRNNALFLKVEQQVNPDTTEPQPEPVATLEEVAIDIFNNKEISL